MVGATERGYVRGWSRGYLILRLNNGQCHGMEVNPVMKEWKYMEHDVNVVV
jgi:hypothetical protein